MKIISIFEEVLTELQGISFDARIWNKIIRNHIKLGKNSPVITIDGQSYPKEYKTFPVDQFNITIKPEFDNGASYDENKSGYDVNKKYHVYLYMGPYSDDSAINHELRHSYEDFMRMSKGNPGLSKSKEAVDLFSGDFEKFMLDDPSVGPFKGLIKGLYYTSKIERSAFSDTVYDGNPGVINYIESFIKSSNYSLIKLRYKPVDLEIWWKSLKDKYKIPITDKFNDYESFIKWASDEIKYKGEKTLKKLRNVNYLSKQKGAK